METVTSFSASLLQSLDGDTAKAAEKANTAIVDMSDNANKMGTSMESIQNAYQGFAKQNYTMLDNLKLGYGGTKEEMQRLLEDAEKLSGQKFDLSSYADIVDAIHVVQTEMGITGTTAKEASSTISGSISSMKSAWQNMLTGMADNNQDAKKLMNDFVDSVVTVADNIIPRIAETLPRIVSALSNLIQKLAPYIPPIIETLLPAIINSAGTLMNELVNALPMIIDTLIGALPMFINGVVQIINGIIEALPQIIQMLVDALPTILPMLIVGAVELVVGLVKAMPKIISSLLKAIPDIVKSIISGIKQAFNNTFPNLASSIKEKFNQLVSNIKSLIKLPHFKISGEFSLNPLKVPSFGIDWYAKAMDEPMIMNSPTAFGINKNGQIMAGGEAGSEVVSGTDTLMNMISEVVSARNARLEEILQSILSYMPQMVNMQVVMDTGATIGALVAPMDKELGRRAARSGRGV